MSTIKFTTFNSWYSFSMTGKGSLIINGVKVDGDLSSECIRSFSNTSTNDATPAVFEIVGDITKFWCYYLRTLEISKDSNMESLVCAYAGQNPKLDVSKLIKLKDLTCTGSMLTSLNVSGCSSLESLNCEGNSTLTSLDVSGLSKLKVLKCNENSLTELKMKGCYSLEVLICNQNQLSSLDLSSLSTSLPISSARTKRPIGHAEPILEELGIIEYPTFSFGDHIPKPVFLELFQKGRSQLKCLFCGRNLLTTLDISKCINLETLDCSYNPFKSLKLKGFGLREIYFGNNELETVDLIECLKLETIYYCIPPNPKSLNLSGHSRIKYLYYEDRYTYRDALPFLDVSGCSSLEIIQDRTLNQSRIKEMDVAGCTSLKKVKYVDALP